MAELSDVSNEFIRGEIEEFVERPDERERMVNLFARISPALQEVAAALIDGDDETVDALTKTQLAEGSPRSR